MLCRDRSKKGHLQISLSKNLQLGVERQGGRGQTLQPLRTDLSTPHELFTLTRKVRGSHNTEVVEVLENESGAGAKHLPGRASS